MKLEEIKKAQIGVKTCLSFCSFIRFVLTKFYTVFSAKPHSVRNNFFDWLNSNACILLFLPIV